MSAPKRKLDGSLEGMVRVAALERLFQLCKKSVELPAKPLSDFSPSMHTAQAKKRMAIDSTWRAIVRQVERISGL